VLINSYDPEGFFDEVFQEPGRPRPEAQILVDHILSLSPGELHHRQKAAEIALFEMGITFTVYGEKGGLERIFPFDVIPRIVPAREWAVIERGLIQRITALNLFLTDIYGARRIIADGVIPGELIQSSRAFRSACLGFAPPKEIWCHITGTDLIRDRDGTFLVLEDNLRCPSGVSYVLENRELLKRTFPRMFERVRVRPVEDYPNRLLEILEFSAVERSPAPKVVVLTPGVFNSAYFEHSFLARNMGVDLVEGRDLMVADGFVFARTTQGFEKVDVIYRRIDDDFLDPEVFRPDSFLGIPGLMKVYRAGNVALANAPGSGVADDKAVYAYVPAIIKYYLGEEAVLPNVPTYICWNDQERDHVLKHLHQLVVKPVNESGGYGILIGPHASAEERQACADKVRANPRNFIAQPVLALSRVPTIVGERLEGRHVDLRPYILFGKEVQVLPGGLTRVALKKGSLIVNSSQGGGSKDTWVMAPEIKRMDQKQGNASC
jgi:uncharacterized circularly permuted ATP-grasp superfamily protein